MNKGERPTNVEKQNSEPATAKTEALENHREHPEGSYLTTDQGVRIADNHNSLKAGPRGPTLLEDFIFR